MIEQPTGQPKIPEVSPSVEAVESAIPTIADLDELLAQVEPAVTVASFSAEEIDDLIEKRQQSLGELEQLRPEYESRLQQAESFNPLKDLKPTDYERLVKEGLLEAAYAEKLLKLDGLIEKIEANPYPTTGIIEAKEKLCQTRSKIREKIETDLEVRQEEIAAEQERLKNEAFSSYAEQLQKLEKIVAEIEANPRVLEQLRSLAETEMTNFLVERQRLRAEAEARAEAEQQATLEEAERCIQSLGDRHNNAFSRLKQLTGKPEDIDRLRLMIAQGENTQGLFDSIRDALIKAIIDGEGEQQLKDPKEILPWRVSTSAIRYDNALNFLRFQGTVDVLKTAANRDGDQALELLRRREQIIEENEIFRRLAGPKWIVVDKKTGRKKQGQFWVAFDTRTKNDETGVTLERRQQHQAIAAEQAAFDEKARGIIGRGGFKVEVKRYKRIQNYKGVRLDVVGVGDGIIRLQRDKSPNGNEIWRVVEVLGETGGMKIGDSSLLDMRSFPLWFRDAAKSHYRQEGDNFVERLALSNQQ